MSQVACRLMGLFVCALLVSSSAVGFLHVQQVASSADPWHRPLDQLLDLYVRDGLVYYAALKSDRGRLDRYVASLDNPAAGTAAYDKWPRDQQIALWINAYNAFVLRTVIDHYPIRGRAPEYPSRSIRQIPGAFERLPHRVTGRTVTLDEIEQKILPAFHDPRIYLALGRGAVGSGRLLSEAYTETRLEAQLAAVAEEFATKPEYIEIDRAGNRVDVSPIIGWHEAEFAEAYASKAAAQFAGRSPVERAILAFVQPTLLPGETDFLGKNEFKVSYQTFDWRLNDLTGGRP